MALSLDIFAVPFTHPQPAAFVPEPTKSKPLVYFTARDVSAHDAQEDCWVSWLGNVFNLTPLLQKHKHEPNLLIPLLRYAGQDISSWFDASTGQLRSHISNLTETLAAYTPEGRFIHLPPAHPRTDFNMQTLDQPWYSHPGQYFVGKLGKRTRQIRVLNTLNGHDLTMEVCVEDSIVHSLAACLSLSLSILSISSYLQQNIQERYAKSNVHAKGYMWKRLGTVLDMSLTLLENGITDDADTFERLGMDEDQFIPTIHIYFSDDLTSA